jgi:quercetin dioxygenase-like cupin family protein
VNGDPLAGRVAALVPAGSSGTLAAGTEGLSCVRATLGAGTDLHAPMGPSEPIVPLDHVEPGTATGARSFQVLYGPHNGSTRGTMFVGYIPPGRAPWHYHLYDEIVWVLRGIGNLHIGDDVEPLAPGVAFRLHPREVHIVENTSREAELAVLGIFTPAGSPSAAYLMTDVAEAYVVQG